MTTGDGRGTTSASSGRFRQAAPRSWSLLKRNIDTAIALVGAAIVSTLGMSSAVSPSTVNSAILGVLAILAIAVIRDRVRDEAHEGAITASGRNTAGLLARMSADLQIVSSVTMQNVELQCLHGEDVERELAVSRDNTHNWLFRGDTGTDVRALTLPRNVEQAKAGAHELYVRLEILDPTDAAACDQYALYRRSQAGMETWDRRQVEYDCYSTILECFRQWQLFPRLRPEIGLSRTVRTLRWEMFDSALFISQEVPSRPVFKVANGRELYECTRTELDVSFDQCRRVDLNPGRAVRLSLTGSGPTHTEVRRLFSLLRLPIPDAYADTDLNNIVERVLRTENAKP